MVVIRDGRKSYTLEEAKVISDIRIKENAKKFAQEVIRRQKINNIKSEDICIK